MILWYWLPLSSSRRPTSTSPFSPPLLSPEDAWPQVILVVVIIIILMILPHFHHKMPNLRSGSVMQSYPDIQSFRPPAPSTISPCGSWVLGGSSCGLAIAWNTDTGENVLFWICWPKLSFIIRWGSPCLEISFSMMMLRYWEYLWWGVLLTQVIRWESSCLEGGLLCRTSVLCLLFYCLLFMFI